MRVLILSQYYAPENVAIPTTLARELAAAGHSVRVLTGFPNYPRGRLYPGFKQRLRQRERDGAVDVMRVPLFVDHSTSAVRRTLNYVSFGLSAATARAFARSADVVYVYATQMTPAFGPWLWRLTGGAPYVLHVQDLWPDSILGSSLVRNGRAARLVESLLTPWLRAVYKRASAVIGIAPSMVDTLVDRGAPAGFTTLVYNWAAHAVEVDASEGSSSATTVVYGGNVGDLQDLGTAVRAAHASVDAGIRLLVVGEGVALESIKMLAADLGANNVEFLTRVPPEGMAMISRAADFSLVPLKDLEVFRATIPSKFQAALALGLPVISTVPGDLRRVVEELGVGLTAPPENVSELAATFRRAADLPRSEREAMRGRATSAYRSMFAPSVGIGQIAAVLKTAAANGRRSNK